MTMILISKTVCLKLEVRRPSKGGIPVAMSYPFVLMLSRQPPFFTASSLSLLRVVRVAICEGQARAARSAGAEEKITASPHSLLVTSPFTSRYSPSLLPLPIHSSFLSLICIILTVLRAEDFRNKNRLLVVYRHFAA